MRLKQLTVFLLVLDIFLAFIWHTTKPSTLTHTNYTEIQELGSKNYTFSELKDYFTKVAEAKGAEYAYKVLKEAPVPPNTDMHLMGHIVGDILYKQQGMDGIKVCTDDFRNACSHSIVVGLLLDKGEETLPDIAKACKLAPGGPGAYTMCYHGLGHGVLAYADFDLKKAINLCAKTSIEGLNGSESVQCIGGAIMEIISGGDHDKKTWGAQREKYLKNNNPLYPCMADFMPNQARQMCLTYLTPHLFEVAGADLGHPTADDFKAAFPYCDKLPEKDKANRDACFGGFGKEFVVLAPERDIRKVDQMNQEQLTKVYTWCKLAEVREGIAACIISAVSSIYWGGENQKGAAINFCALIDDNYYQKTCFMNLIAAVSFYIKDTIYRNEFCRELPTIYQKECQEKLT